MQGSRYRTEDKAVANLAEFQLSSRPQAVVNFFLHPAQAGAEIGAAVAGLLHLHQFMRQIQRNHQGDFFDTGDLAAVAQRPHPAVELLGGGEQFVLLLWRTGDFQFAIQQFEGQDIAHGWRLTLGPTAFAAALFMAALFQPAQTGQHGFDLVRRQFVFFQQPAALRRQLGGLGAQLGVLALQALKLAQQLIELEFEVLQIGLAHDDRSG